MTKNEQIKNNMDDIDILRGLYEQRTSLEWSLQKAEMRVDDIKAELSRINRLIDLLEEAELKRLELKRLREKTENENKNILG